jgi:hypothetical protein
MECCWRNAFWNILISETNDLREYPSYRKSSEEGLAIAHSDTNLVRENAGSLSVPLSNILGSSDAPILKHIS